MPRNTVTGFIAGLGGMLMLPVAIPSSVAASLAIQASMVAAIAELYGHRSEDDHVRILILACMLGTGIEEVAKKTGPIVVGEKIAIELLKGLPGKVLIKINKKIGFRLLTKFGEKGVVNLVKLVPVVGGVVGGALGRGELLGGSVELRTRCFGQRRRETRRLWRSRVGGVVDSVRRDEGEAANTAWRCAGGGGAGLERRLTGGGQNSPHGAGRQSVAPSQDG